MPTEASGLCSLIMSAHIRDSGSMTLFLQSDIGYPSGSMILYVGGTTYNAYESMPLFLLNSDSGVDNYMTLFMSGYGITPGAIPYSGDMNLFIRCGLGEMIPMFISGPGTESNNYVDLVCWGNNSESEEITLFLDGVGTISNSTTLFSHGF